MCSINSHFPIRKVAPGNPRGIGRGMQALGRLRSRVRPGLNPFDSIQKYSIYHYSTWKNSVIAKKEIEEDIRWTRSNDAKALLNDFISNVSNDNNQIGNMNEYINHRLVSNSINQTSNHASQQRVLSSLLTYPLTISHALRTVFPLDHIKPNMHIVVLGARAESSLPSIWWKEVLYSQHVAQSTKITMVGPGQALSPRATKPHQHSWNNKNVEVHTGQYTELFHALPNHFELLFTADMFVLFHPGFGHEKMTPLWMPTLELLFQTRKPIYCTAYSPTDLQRDIDKLQQCAEELDSQDLGESLEFIVPPTQNPFASARPVVNENDEVTIANYYHYCFQAK
jgi:hypothetical protein